MSNPNDTRAEREALRLRNVLRTCKKEHGILAVALLAPTAVLAAPLDAALNRVVGIFGSHRDIIDVFQAASFAVSCALLCAAPPVAWLIVWPLVRVPDTLYAFVRLFVLGREPQSKPRAVALLILHYVEVVVLFAFVLNVAQHWLAGGATIFLRNGTARLLGRSELLFFSFVTASTIGFGDITPNHDAALVSRLVVYSLLWLETMVVFSFSVVELSRIMSARDRPSGGQAARRQANGNRRRGRMPCRYLSGHASSGEARFARWALKDADASQGRIAEHEDAP